LPNQEDAGAGMQSLLVWLTRAGVVSRSGQADVFHPLLYDPFKAGLSKYRILRMHMDTVPFLNFCSFNAPHFEIQSWYN
jgi:hypothetical protein